MFTLNKAELKALVCHASNDDTRACLNALGCFPRDGRIVTTDGHRMLIRTDRAQARDEQEYVVRLDIAEQALRLLKKDGLVVITRRYVDVYPSWPFGTGRARPLTEHDLPDDPSRIGRTRRGARPSPANVRPPTAPLP